MEKMEKIISPTLRQLLAASACGLLSAGLMSSWGYPSAALPQMEQANSTIHFTVDQASWFATVTLFMSIPGSLVGSMLCEWMGPRLVFLSLAPPFCLSYIAMASASWEVVQEAGASEILLLVTRAIQATLVALMTPIASVYTYEISSRQVRGTLTSLIDVWCSLGFLLCYISGCFLKWETIAWIMPFLTTIPGFFGLLIAPESPQWLIRKGKTIRAKKILNAFRPSEQEISEEMRTLQNDKSNVTLKESLKTISNKSNILAIIASCGVLCMKELIGNSAIMIYIVHIFDATEVGLDAKVSSVVVGLVRMFCNVIASILIHRYPRKLLLIGGNVSSALSSITIGLFFYLQSIGEDLSYLGWLPLVALNFQIFATSTFVSPTAWVAAVEVLPAPVRSVGFGIAVMSYSVIAFLTSKMFMHLQLLVGMHGIFWLFTGGSFSYVLLITFYVPETLGLSLQDIEDYWKNSYKKKQGTLV